MVVPLCAIPGALVIESVVIFGMLISVYLTRVTIYSERTKRYSYVA